jgi:hypothetical protein
MYASLLRISAALHLGIFDQPAKNDLFNRIEISDDLRRLRRYFREGQSIG